jgi:hypothetical protein
MLASSTSPPEIDPKCQPKGNWAMLLTRKAWYGLIAVKHLAEQPRENSFSAKDQRTFMDFPRKRWPRSFNDSLGPACYCRITESRAGIDWHVTRARFPCST